MSWYMRRAFPTQRAAVRFARAARGASSSSDLLPDDDYFAELQNLEHRLENLDEVFRDRRRTSVRLVATPERIVVDETKRTHLYLSLYGLSVDMVIMNKIMQDDGLSPFLRGWCKIQMRHIAAAKQAFENLPLAIVPFLENEPIGLEALRAVGETIYGRRNPLALARRKAFRILEESGQLLVEIALPHAQAREVRVLQNGAELTVGVGDHIRTIALPMRYAQGFECNAEFTKDFLTLRLSERKGGEVT
jgi:arsenite-transporting ATPase